MLLEDYSLEELAAATLTRRIVWEESMDTSKAAAKHARFRRTTLDELNCAAIMMASCRRLSLIPPRRRRPRSEKEEGTTERP